METKWVQKWRWFWAWQDDQEEAWLSRMSKQGLHLTGLGLPGAYLFEPGEAVDYVYRLDFISDPQMDRRLYFHRFQSAGWEHIGESFGWQYFRTLAPAGMDAGRLAGSAAKIAKYKRLLDILTTSIPVSLMLLWMALSASQSSWRAVMVAILAAFVLLNTFIVLKLMGRIRALKSS